MTCFKNGPVGKFTKFLMKLSFEPEAPSLLVISNAREVLYRTELRALYEHDNYSNIIKKEVIQPQVPLRLPCDDLTLLAEFRFEPIKNWTSSKHYSGGLTGGVCKEQGHIHRSIMRNDY